MARTNWARLKRETKAGEGIFWNKGHRLYIRQKKDLKKVWEVVITHIPEEYDERCFELKEFDEFKIDIQKMDDDDWEFVKDKARRRGTNWTAIMIQRIGDQIGSTSYNHGFCLIDVFFRSDEVIIEMRATKYDNPFKVTKQFIDDNKIDIERISRVQFDDCKEAANADN